MTFCGRRPLVEDNLQWKTTFGGRWLSMEDNLRWKTTFGGRQPSVEDNLQWSLACCLLRFAAFFSVQTKDNNEKHTHRFLLLLTLLILEGCWVGPVVGGCWPITTRNLQTCLLTRGWTSNQRVLPSIFWWVEQMRPFSTLPPMYKVCACYHTRLHLGFSAKLKI